MTQAKVVLSPQSRQTRLKPREKAKTFGITNLTTTELLALVIGSGTTKCSVFSLAKKLAPLIESGQFAKKPPDHKIIGEALFWRLQAVCELAHRQTNFTPTITHPADIWQICSYLGQKQQEHVVGLYLDGRQKLLEKRILAIGGQNFAMLEPAALLHPALLLPACSCVLVHNHPSGCADPSQDDLLVTKRLIAACRLMGIELLDHVVIGKNTYCSLKELGHLQSD